LLLAIAEEGRGAAAFVLKQLNISVRDVRRVIIQQPVTRRRALQSSVPLLSLSASAKSILRDAEVEAMKLAHGFVGSEHLLIAMARQGATRMGALGLTAERVQREVIALVGQKPQ
jgi:ATP-dependent Clp protease ATP-binding subunit ClpC